MALPRIRPMTPADVEPVAAAFIRENWGDRRLNLEFVTRHAETHPFVAEADGQIVGTGVLSVNGSVGWIGTIWVEPAWRRQGVGMALTAGDGRRGRVGRLPDAPAGGHRRRPAALREDRLRGPDLVSDPRGAGARRRARSTPGSGRTRRPTCPRWPSSPPPRPARTGRICWPRSHRPRRRPASCATTGRLGGFVVRAPWGGGSTIAPRLEDAEAILHARRVGRGPDQQDPGRAARRERGRARTVARDRLDGILAAPRG